MDAMNSTQPDLADRFAAVVELPARGERARGAGRHLPFAALAELTEAGLGQVGVPAADEVAVRHQRAGRATAKAPWLTSIIPPRSAPTASGPRCTPENRFSPGWCHSTRGSRAAIVCSTSPSGRLWK